jgi:uncharacterized membrane protein YqjE
MTMNVSSEPVSPPDSVFNEVVGVFVAMRRTVSSFFELFSAEVRRAGLTFLWMAMGGAIAAMFIVTAWLGLMCALGLWVVSLGATWISAIIVVAMGNLLAAATSLLVCTAMSRNLLFPATREQLELANA